MNKCSVETCQRPYACKGYCTPHYNRLKKYGEVFPDTPIAERQKIGNECLVENCRLPVKAKCLCSAHYLRLRQTGKIQPEVPLRQISYEWNSICSVDKCESKARKLGRCEMHYQRYRATGVDYRPDFCEICSQSCAPHWDHDHLTGQFRGWICRACNMVLGSVKDNVDTLKSMVQYLEKNEHLE